MRAISGFDWDDGNRIKCQKHGLTIAEIEAVLSGGPRVAPDILHSVAEARYIAIGDTPTGRPVFIAFTYRLKQEAWLIRPVSARFMHQREAKRYAPERPPHDH